MKKKLIIFFVAVTTIKATAQKTATADSPKAAKFNETLNEAKLNSYTLSPLHQHIQHYRLYTNNHCQLGGAEIDANIGFQQNIRRKYSHPTAPQQAGLFVQLNAINYGIKYTAPDSFSIEITVCINRM